MGTKATFIYLNFLVVLVTIGCAGLAIVGWFAGYIPPTVWWSATWISLGMLPLVITNFLFFVYWSIRFKAWLLVPLSALLLNINFITAMFQVELRAKNVYENTLKVASYNIFEFHHHSVHYTSKNIAQFLKDEHVDVICFQEFPDPEEISQDSVRALFQFMPYSIIPLTKNGFHLAIFSKYPIMDSAYIPFDDTDNSSMWVDIDYHGKTIRIFNNHLQTTSVSQCKNEIKQIGHEGVMDKAGREALDSLMGRLRHNFGKRVEQVASVRSIIDTTIYPMIVCGDFNDTPVSYTYRRMKEGLRDGFKTCGSGYGYTFRGLGKMLRLDYILYSDQLVGVHYYSPSLDLSDHNPVILELWLRN